MSRYDAYDAGALEVLRRAQDHVRRQKRDECDVPDLLTGFLLAEVTETKAFLQQNGLSALPETRQATGEDAPGEAQTASKLRISTGLRTVFDRAEELAEGRNVQTSHLLHAAWPEHAQDLVSQVRKDGRTPEVDEIRLPPLPKPESTPEMPVAPPAKPLRQLTELARELTAAARDVPVIGRDREMDDVIGILLKCFKPNAMLVGEPGVGKTAIVEGLAQRIRDGNVPARLTNCRIFELRISDLLAGTGVHGSFEQRMRELVEELESNRDVILFLDEIHQLVQPGRPSNPADILKPALARGRFRSIGATTMSDYYRSVHTDAALARRFQTVRVEEPDDAATLAILEGVAPAVAQHYDLEIPSEILPVTIRLAREHLVQRRFPDKAIDLLDQCCAAVARSDDGKLSAARLRETVARMVGIASLADDDAYRGLLSKLEELLSERIVGQEAAVAAVANTVRLCKRRLDLRPERPDGVFLLIGPTGVGKTALAEALAEVLCGDAGRLSRIDMSEFAESHTISRLIGSPAGYVGYGDEPQLVHAIRNNPSGVLLLDELEKAHPTIHRLFLQAFDAGRLTDATGETVSLANITIVATANIRPAHKATVGFTADPAAAASAEADLPWDELGRHFPLELINRFDEIVLFQSLSEDAVREILQRRVLKQANENMRRQHGMTIDLSAEMENEIVARGFSESFGVRHLQRAFEELVLRPLALQIDTFRAAPGDPESPPVTVGFSTENGPSFAAEQPR